MLERRRADREITAKRASISFGVAAVTDCTIVNLSATGACLDFAFRAVLPKEFSVIIKPEYIRRSCRVAWQDGPRIGVTFTAKR